MIFSDVSTWNTAFVAHLNAHFREHSCDELDLEVVDRLFTSETLLGYHCTRLIHDELSHILSHGMDIPDCVKIRERIRKACGRCPLLTPYLDRLLSKNERSPECEQYHLKPNELWFFFYRPGIDAAFRSERFFRYWGGECVYRPFEDEVDIREVLETIGTPCIVEADVPIASLCDRFTFYERLVNRFMVEFKLRTEDEVGEVDHTGAIRTPLSASGIRRIANLVKQTLKPSPVPRTGSSKS